ncbi:hypothetical protein ACJ72_00691 [Emergomyces africanus]|uniref:60S ribosomal protein L31 n=1 Tax=Emergomyces africanus TaxID=1955775 RepID=A0A1B7P7G7_9EURO|nr:hypothetical protein ACJ72_00691 [Emergomyces africanus]
MSRDIFEIYPIRTAKRATPVFPWASPKTSSEIEHFAACNDDNDKPNHPLNANSLPRFAAMSSAKAGKKSQRSAISDVVSREYTIHLHRRVHGVSFKKRAPRAIKEIRAFAEQAMVRFNPAPLCMDACMGGKGTGWRRNVDGSELPRAALLRENSKLPGMPGRHSALPPGLSAG